MADVESFRVGTLRTSFAANQLLAKAELGTVKRTTFSNPPPDHVFGYKAPADPEGAREVTMKWKEHTPSANKAAGTATKPKLDFTAMNKLSAMSGLTKANQQGAFRTTHPVTVKLSDTSAKPGPGLPSDVDPSFTYGMPGTYRSADTVRQKGPYEPPMKYLVQGAYANDWVAETLSKQSSLPSKSYVPPVPTRAAIGHAIGAQQKYLRQPAGGEEWKMTKFRTTPSRVTQYMSGTTGAAAAAAACDGAAAAEAGKVEQ